MSALLIFTLVASLTAVNCQFVLPSSPTRALVIEQPAASASYITISTPLPPPSHIGASVAAITATPVTSPTTHARARNELSAGERATLASPGFRIGDINEPIQVLPPAIGNWHETSAPQTNITITTSTPAPGRTFAGPWAAIAADDHTTINLNITVNATTHGNTTSTSLNITVTPHSPTWVDVQGERVNGFASTWPTDSHTIRPRDFPTPRLRSSNNVSMTYNITIHGNITSFNMSIINMTHIGNATRVGGGMDGWFGSWLPTGTAGNGGESTIHANLTGPHMNITIITPNSTTIISTEPNGTVTIEGNTTDTKPISPPSSAATLVLSSFPLCFITLFFAVFVAGLV